MARARVTGVRSSLNRLEDQIEDEIDRELRRRTLAALADVKVATPVDTGRARNSWRYDVDYNGNREGQYELNSYVVENTVNYIERLNMGSSRQAPSNFIESAFLRYFDNVSVEVYTDEGD